MIEFDILLNFIAKYFIKVLKKQLIITNVETTCNLISYLINVIIHKNSLPVIF